MVIQESASVIALMRLIGLMRLIYVSLMLYGLTISKGSLGQAVRHDDQCSGYSDGLGGLCWLDDSNKGRHFFYCIQYAHTKEKLLIMISSTSGETKFTSCILAPASVGRGYPHVTTTHDTIGQTPCHAINMDLFKLVHLRTHLPSPPTWTCSNLLTIRKRTVGPPLKGLHEKSIFLLQTSRFFMSR